ncbi:hypothetical protein C8R43DRAFT_1119265 [Mycena crocata]|nr:hypothetical protein C8R43DRAFT_1125165 [Mycena crocata]KAJ7175252.1 hypothetical protein C8R43DRAFT_1119265 [Mycena crocata]
MTDTVPTPANNASTPQAEMDALLAMVGNLSQMSLNLTRLCIEVQNVVPGIALSRQSLEMTSACLDVKDQIRHAFAVVAEAAAAAAAPPPPSVNWVRRQALTPDQLETSHPHGLSDDSAYQVVTIGREPGIFISSDYASTNISGVPKGFRKKKDSRVEALAFYRSQFEAGKVEKWVDVPIVPSADSVAVDDSVPAVTAGESVVIIDSDSESDRVDSHPIGHVVGDKNLVRFKTKAIAE